VRDRDAVHFSVPVDVIGTASAAQHINSIIVPPHQPIGTKIGHLLTRMTGDVIGKGDLQASPSLAVLVPSLDLFGYKTRIGIEKWLSKIGPQRVRIKICSVKPIPGRFVDVARECSPRAVTALDHLARISFQNQSVRREADMPVRRAKAAECRALPVNVGLVGRVSEQPSLALQVLQRAPNRQFKRDGAV